MPQRGYAQTTYDGHLDPFLPGMIASQYPKAIKTGLFKASNDTEQGRKDAYIKFGLACGRHGAGSVATGTPSNFGDEGGRPVNINTTDGYAVSPAMYSAGGGAIVTEKISYERTPVGLVTPTPTPSNGVINSKTTTLLKIDGDKKIARDSITAGDYLQITAPSAAKAQREIVRVASVSSVGTDDITLNVLRGQFGTSAANTIADDDEVNIIGRTNTFAGVCVKDITIDGRWDPDKNDSFVHGDRIPVGVEGDFAVIVCGAEDTAPKIKADDPVSVFVGSTETSGSHPRIHGMFSNQPPDSEYILLRNARFTTDFRAVNTYPQTGDGPGPGLASPTPVNVAVARFAGNV